MNVSSVVGPDKELDAFQLSWVERLPYSYGGLPGFYAGGHVFNAVLF